MRDIFVPAVGQFDNIGDLILRRPLLERLRRHGRLHVYTGAAPAGYVSGLRLDPEDAVYRSFAPWHGALVRAAIRRTADYAFKPGEIQLTIRGMKEHLGLLPALSLVRSGGGTIVRVGSGARSFPRGGRTIIAPSLGLPHVTRWRDTESARVLGHGGTMPDLAFLEGPATVAHELRDRVVVSMRGDRPAPGPAWLAGLREFARRLDGRLVVVTQVERDARRAYELGQEWGCEVVAFDGIDHRGHEERVREVYRSAVAVASDRLHVLIAAFTEGALPVAPLTAPASKIDRHCAAALLPPVSIVVRDEDASSAANLLSDIAARSRPALDTLESTRAALATALAEVDRALGGHR